MLVLLIVSVGVHLAMTGLGLIFFGAEGSRTPPFAEGAFNVGTMTITGQSIAVVGTSALLIVALYLFFEFTLYGKALRANGERSQAAAVLEQAALQTPKNKPLLAAYGRALADNGNFQQAFDVLGRAHSPDSPDWRILSVQGTALDQLGKHQEARGYYESALRIAPDEPSVLSNLGLSYVLSRDLPKAEETLRKAQATGRADGRVRQNLALAVGLQGRFAEAETIARADLPADEAAAHVAILKQMLARKDVPRTAARAGKLPVVAQDLAD